MQNTNPTLSALQRSSVQEGHLQSLPQIQKPAHNAAVRNTVASQGFLARAMRFFAQLFSRKQQAPVKTMEAAATLPEALTAAERIAAAHAAQMPSPIAFKGNSTTSLVTPIGSYAGKPVDYAMRKRAEQQFHTMDITTATKN